MKVLITGANSGFGKMTVHQLLEKGHQVAAAMRAVNGKNKEVAEELESAGATVVEIDVANDESVKSGVALAIQKLDGIDVLVNNAGVGVMGMQEQFTIEDFQKLFEVNVFGVQRMNREVIPHLRKQHSGLIIYTSSLLARLPLPFFGPYNASKWALEGLVENYRIELSGFGIENAIVEPGAFGTNFSANLMQASDRSTNQDYQQLLSVMQQMGEGFGKALAENEHQNPEKVVEAIVTLIEAKKGERPFRTIVDYMGMGALTEDYNAHLEKITHQFLGGFHMNGMLKVQ